MKNSTLDRYKDTDLGSFCQKRAESEPSKPEVGPPSQTGTPRDLNGNQGETKSGPAQPPTPPPTPTSPDYNSPTTTAPESDAQYRETLQEFKEKHRGIYSTPPIDLPLHFRAMLRLGRKWWGVPDRHCTGFRFYDPTSKFSNIEKAGCFIHLYRQRRIEIHSCMRRQFLNLLAPLKAYGAKWNVRRVKVDRHYVEIIEVVCGWYCVLVALRNWCNPLFEEEVARIVKAFQHIHPRQLHGTPVQGRVEMRHRPSLRGWTNKDGTVLGLPALLPHAIRFPARPTRQHRTTGRNRLPARLPLRGAVDDRCR